MAQMVLIGQILRALSSLGNSALFINLSGRRLETKDVSIYCFRYCFSISHFESVLQANFHKHFKFAFTIPDRAKCHFYDFALKIRAFTEKSARPLVQNRHNQKVRYFRAQFLTCNRQTDICQKIWINSNQCLTERNNREKNFLARWQSAVSLSKKVCFSCHRVCTEGPYD